MKRLRGSFVTSSAKGGLTTTIAMSVPVKSMGYLSAPPFKPIESRNGRRTNALASRLKKYSHDHAIERISPGSMATTRCNVRMNAPGGAVFAARLSGSWSE